MTTHISSLPISVVVPAHNEQGNVENLVREISDVDQICNIHEIIFVDDNSSDQTLNTLTDLKQKFTKLRVIHHENQCGQSAAIFSGVKASKSEWVATLDGDGQNIPGDIPRLVTALTECKNPDVKLINGNRNRGANRQDNWIKKMSSKIANSVRSFMLKDNIPDSGCGLKLMHRETYLSLPYFTNLHRFTPALFIRTGSEILSVNVGHRPREAGSSHYGLFNRLWIGIVDLIGVTWLMNKGYRARAREVE